VDWRQRFRLLPNYFRLVIIITIIIITAAAVVVAVKLQAISIVKQSY